MKKESFLSDMQNSGVSTACRKLYEIYSATEEEFSVIGMHGIGIRALVEYIGPLHKFSSLVQIREEQPLPDFAEVADAIILGTGYLHLRPALKQELEDELLYYSRVRASEEKN